MKYSQASGLTTLPSGKASNLDQVRYTSPHVWENVRRVHIFVHMRDVLFQMCPDGRELASIRPHHTKFVDFAQSPEIEQCQTNNLDEG